jgi:hypothetical protein
MVLDAGAVKLQWKVHVSTFMSTAAVADALVGMAEVISLP